MVVHPETTGSTVAIIIDFRSEDAGEDLVALLYLNWSIAAKEQFKDLNIVPASTLEQSRKVSGLFWNIEDDEVGCQQLSLLLFHRSGYDAAKKRPLPGADVALVTWWFNVTDPQSPQDVLLSECPANVGGT